MIKKDLKNWKKLLKNCCPKCGSSLKKGVYKQCSNIKCDFMISEEKFSKIVLSMLKEINQCLK